MTKSLAAMIALFAATSTAAFASERATIPPAQPLAGVVADAGGPEKRRPKAGGPTAVRLAARAPDAAPRLPRAGGAVVTPFATADAASPSPRRPRAGGAPAAASALLAETADCAPVG